MNERRLIEANTRLVDEIRGLNYDIAMLESIINKAIKYIRELKANAPDEIALEKLLNILHGEDYE